MPTTDPLSPTTKWYQIKTENVYLCTMEYDSELWPSTTASTAGDHLWCFVGTESTGYKILSRSRRYYLRDAFSVNGIGTESDLNYVELGSGNSFYIAYKYRSQTMYLSYDSDNDAFYGNNSKYNTYTVTEVNAGTLPPMDSDAPVLTMITASDRCSITATGRGIITLSISGEEVENPFIVIRSDLDKQVTITATAQQPARLPTSVTKTFLIPRLQADAVQGDLTGDGRVDIADVNAVINMMLGKNAATEAGDVTGDGRVDIADVNAVINIMLGKDMYSANGVKFKMIQVDGGTFTMGNDNSYYDEPKPAHEVTVSSFKIGQTEVTQELWQAVMGSNPSYFQTSTNAEFGTILKRPVEQVSWYDCQEFITKLNQITGKTFRLPTEAEWEFAARGGNKSQGYIYPGSNDYEEVAFYWHNSGPEVNPYGGPKTTHPVAQKKPNELGLYDMSGNVNEWCHDWYSATYYSESPTDNPTGPADPVSIYPARVVRGDAYDDWIAFYDEEDFAVWERGSARPNNKSENLGLRLVLGNPLPEPNVEPTPQTLTATGYNVPHNYLSNTGNEGYAKLIDGDKTTKWCVVNNSGSWETICLDFKSDVAFKPTSYILTTGNDTHENPNRNPKEWILYGRATENDEWTTLAHVTDGGGLEAKNTTDYTFPLTGITQGYRFFRFEVRQINGKNPSDNNYVFQLAELTLMGVAQ